MTLAKTHMFSRRALGCSETGKTWVTPANPHSQTGLAQNAERLSGPSRSMQTGEVESRFCVKLGNYRQVCSLSSRPTNDMLGAHGRPQPGSLARRVSGVCSCEICPYVCVMSVTRITMCYTCKVSVCDSTLGVTTFMFFGINTTNRNNLLLTYTNFDLYLWLL